ncbi:MAG: NAD-dependent epimerase/dehydratase family protein, partial [Lachnospiraceae bacterium]|nr:NAD-dependent epimerase/dehydratase family protein [Lachnospiraceae bacterium]
MGKRILVTGSNGFIARNLIYNLKNAGYSEIDCYNHNSTDEELDQYIERADFIYHLAGVNRPQDNSEFFEGNAMLTRKIVSKL